jgi:hypothetical protein
MKKKHKHTHSHKTQHKIAIVEHSWLGLEFNTAICVLIFLYLFRFFYAAECYASSRRILCVCGVYLLFIRSLCSNKRHRKYAF